MLLMVCECVIMFGSVIFFFFKQKTAYEMRISDWSSDVCSSDLRALVGDASQEEDAATFAAAAEAWAPLAVAVHNAGTNRRDSFLDLEVAHFEQLWREHTLGAFLTGREAARRMVPRGAGTILFTGATGSIRGKALFGDRKSTRLNSSH